jgi:hypothetical protein
MDETWQTAILWGGATALICAVTFLVARVTGRGRRRLLKKYGVLEADIQLLDSWTAGTLVVRSKYEWQCQSDSDCWAPCTSGVAFCRSTGLWSRYQHFVIPWSDVVCSMQTRWPSEDEDYVVFHFEDPPEDLLSRPTKKMLQIIKEHCLIE